MSLEAARLTQPLTAHRALARTLAAVRQHVTPEIPGLRENPVAQSTAELAAGSGDDAHVGEISVYGFDMLGELSRRITDHTARPTLRALV